MSVSVKQDTQVITVRKKLMNVIPTLVVMVELAW